MAKAAKVEVSGEGEWSSEAPFFEQEVGDGRVVRACIATSPDGTKFVSVREWREKRDGTPYYTRNSVLVPMANGDFKLAMAFTAALQPGNWPQPKAPKEFEPKKARAVAAKAKAAKAKVAA